MWVVEHCPAGEEWKKEFTTEAEAVACLLAHICADCLKGDILVVDSTAENGLRREKLCDAPDQSSARDLLSTPCGCEYELYENRFATRAASRSGGA